jgi:phosphatidate cytidylyltransferase
MLKQRVITAVVLLALLLPALFAEPAWPFALLTLLLIGAAGWEWGRLNGAGALSVGLGVVLALACVGAFWVGWVQAVASQLWMAPALLWVIGGAWALNFGPAGWPGIAAGLRWVLGLVLLWTAWLAMASARAVGINFILSVFCLVWVADIAAYFGGRTFGRRKLAPTISPGKSWEGVWSGMAGALLLAWLWSAVIDAALPVDSASLYTQLLRRVGLPGFVVAVLGLAAMSVVGDLFESLVKRSAGVKDSSGLLPGHGGVLDRVDALLPVLPISLALLSI